MLLLNYEITLGEYKVAHLLSCEVRKSANKLSDTATIKLSGMAYSKALEIESKIKRGNEVSIKLGYNDELKQEFTGYINSIATDNTIVIECEDGMYSFRKAVENKVYQTVLAATIIEDVAGQIGGFSVVKGKGVDDVKFSKFTISNATAYEVLKKLKAETGLHIFVKGKELHVHLKYTYKEGAVKFDYSKNVEASSLKYVNVADKKVQVEMVGINRKNEKIKVTDGEPGGDKITLYRYNIDDEAALKVIAKEEVKKYSYTGYDGDLSTWLLPYCTYSYTVEIVDEQYPDRKGVYYVTAVTTSFSTSGANER